MSKNESETNNLVPKKEELSFTLITCAPSGTLGDVSSCKKLVDLVKQLKTEDLPDTKFNLVITGVDNKADKERITALLEDPEKYHLMLASNRDENFFLKRDFAKTDAFIFYPSFQITSDFHIKKIRCWKKPTFIINHYNFDASTDTRYAEKKQLWMPSLSTGLGAKSLGVYIEDAEAAPINFNPKDSAFWNLLLSKHDSDVTSYSSDSSLFFGYMNKLGFLESKRNLVNPGEFAKACIAKSLKQNPEKQSIDIVVRLNNRGKKPEFDYYSQLIGQFEKMNRNDLKISVYKKNSEGKIVKTKTIGNGKTQVRIMDPFPISHSSMLNMMRLSDPFCMMTGSESFIESISCAKLPLYQIMHWHDELFDMLLDEISNIEELGYSSLLYHYFSLQIKSKNISIEEQYDSLVNFLCDNEGPLLEQIRIFKNYLMENKQLSKKLHRELCVLVNPIAYINRSLGIDNIIDIKDEPELTTKIEALPGSILQLMDMFPGHRDEVIGASNQLLKHIFNKDEHGKRIGTFIEGCRKLYGSETRAYLLQALLNQSKNDSIVYNYINYRSEELSLQLDKVEKYIQEKYSKDSLTGKKALNDIEKIQNAQTTFVYNMMNSPYKSKDHVNEFQESIKESAENLDKLLGKNVVLKACENFVKAICCIIGSLIITVLCLPQSKKDKFFTFFSSNKSETQQRLSTYMQKVDELASTLIEDESQQNSEMLPAPR